MISKRWGRDLLIMLICVSVSQSCSEIGSRMPSSAVPGMTETLSLTVTNVPAATQTPIPNSTLTITPTPVPPGVFVLLFFPLSS